MGGRKEEDFDRLLQDLKRRVTALEGRLSSPAERGSSKRAVTATLEQLEDEERQEIEAAAAGLSYEASVIREMIDSERPMTVEDRAKIARLLLTCQDRFVGLTNEIRRIQGPPPLPTRWGREQ